MPLQGLPSRLSKFRDDRSVTPLALARALRYTETATPVGAALNRCAAAASPMQSHNRAGCAVHKLEHVA